MGQTAPFDPVPCYDAGMETEYEAKFLDIEPNRVRDMLKDAGATLERPEFLQRRWIIELPEATRQKGVWLRVRDEGDKITLTWKSQLGEKIEDQKEIELIIDDFDNAVELLEKMGCTPESYQETRRELWLLDNVEITIDTWPFYGSFVEVEGTSEEIVQAVATKIGFDWSKALFCGVSKLYQMKFGDDVHIRKMPKLTFEMQNPF